MQKPKDFDSVAASLYFEPLSLGGHPCVIKGIEEMQSKNGKPMYKIAVDIADGDPQAGYYTEKFNADDRPNKKWPCVTYVVLEDKDGGCSRQLAGFVTSIEESNPGFAYPWGAENFLKGKKVGAVFGQEEYMGTDDKVHKSTKLFWFCSLERAKDAKVPKLKELKAGRTSTPATAWADISADDAPF